MSASILWQTCCWRGRLTLAKAEGANHLASFVLALLLAEDRLVRPHTSRCIVPSVGTQRHVSPPWRRPPLSDCPAPSTAARSALVKLTFCSLPVCVADACLGSTSYATACGPGSIELSAATASDLLPAEREWLFLSCLRCLPKREGRSLRARRNSRRESHCLRLLKQKLRAAHLLSSAL